MALRRFPVAALTMLALLACKDKGDGEKGIADINRRCEQLSMACGDKEKHVDKLLDECGQVGKKQVDKGCTAKAIAVYDCYEKELCGGKDKVWTLDDLRVLADRHKKCVAERDALRACVD